MKHLSFSCETVTPSMARSQSDVCAAWASPKPGYRNGRQTGRLVYEDRSARISIMARAKAYRPDTLQQTAWDQLASIHLQTGGGPYISVRTAIAEWTQLATEKEAATATLFPRPTPRQQSLY